MSMPLLLARRLRPRIGWRQTGLALSVAICPALAAANSKLNLPATTFFWAGLFGLLIGLRIGRIPASAAQPTRPAARTTRYALGFVLWTIVLLALVALLVVAAIKALPPFGLMEQDVTAFLGWAIAFVRKRAGVSELPAGRTWEFLDVSLGRFWDQLRIAPSDGERGARLLLTVGGILVTWVGVLTLGYGLARRRNVFVWALPLLTAIALTAILGAATGGVLPVALFLLLLLTLVSTFNRRTHDWSQSGTDYSDELKTDVLMWGGSVVGVVLLLALVLPTSLDNPIAKLLWRDVELPSGIAVLERDIPRTQPQPVADVGISRLPALELGLSLEQQPPEEVALRVHLAAPLPPGPWPHYWRARVFNLYNGRGWTTNARVGPFDALPPPDVAIPGTIAQDIEDLRRDRTILIGIPTIDGISVGAQSERLTDGTLTALTALAVPEQAARYRVLSSPQELASPPPTDREPPDLSGYLGLPKNMPPRVGDLAQAIAGSDTRAYDRALALESYLRKLPYSYQVQPLPGDGDAVEQFLFDMRQGYCTYYASAMAVMARSLGIPARVAIGYATGAYDQASGAYIVHEADAHAWPELYIDGRWLPFEPTPIRPLPARTAEDAIPPVAAPAPAEEPQNTSGPLIWAGVLAIVVLLSGLGFWATQPRRARSLATQVQLKLERGGARAGIPWPEGATLHEYAALLEPHTTGDTRALHEVVELLAQARYSGQELRGEEEGRLRAAAARVWDGLKKR